MKRKKYVIGVDEAGRGPLAGPVTSAAVLISSNFKAKKESPDSGIRDSKKYSERQRQEWLSYIEDNDDDIKYEFSSVWPKKIDKINIFEAASLAATRSVKRLMNQYDIQPDEANVLLDGSLKLKTNDVEFEVIIKGDEKEDSIKLASIVAKVKRDTSMKRIHKKHNKYGFLDNKGYGTKDHRDRLKQYGPCKYHRQTFIKNCC